MKMTKRERSLVIVLIILVFVLAYWMLFLNPHINAMDEIAGQKTDAQTQLFEMSLKQVQYEELQKQIADKDKQIGDFGKSIPEGYDQPAVIVYLKETIGKNAAKQVFAFAEPGQSGQMLACPVSVTMRCTYEGLKNVLSDLAAGSYYVNVVGLSAKPGEDETVTTTRTNEDGEEVSVATVVPSDKIDVVLELVFFCLAGDVPADTAYAFDSGYQFGGDIFK